MMKTPDDDAQLHHNNPLEETRDKTDQVMQSVLKD